MTATDRPQPGHLTAGDAWKLSAQEYELARDGKAGDALYAAAINRQEKAANELHYLLRRLSDEFDRAAKDLEAGKRRFILPGSSQYYEVPMHNSLLNEATLAVEEARSHLGVAAQDHPNARAHRLEQAAATLDATVEEHGLKGAHPLADQLRAEAKAITDAHEGEQQAKRDEAKADHEAKVARIKKSPLGLAEQHALHKASTGGIVTGRYSKESEKKAVMKLVTRGYLARVGSTSHGTEFQMTEEGSAAALAMASA